MALALYCVAPGTTGVAAQVVEYTPLVESLRCTSVAPGGCGLLVARIRLPSARARLPKPEFAILNARAVLMDGLYCAFTGEINQSALTLDASGQGVEITALGGGAGLSDDPLDTTYTNQTALQIIQDQVIPSPFI